MEHKAGFVNIIGSPNVGKSTIINQLMGEKLAIVTPKAQTTRQRLLGIDNEENYQIVYSDTPGILKPAYKMQESMLYYVNEALEDADILIYVTDVIESVDKNKEILEKITKFSIPLMVLVNKIDLSDEKKVKELITWWNDFIPKAETIPVSAIKNFNLSRVKFRILELLPVSPPYFPKDEITDKTERFITAEIIREKTLLLYKQEIPYSVEVVIEDFKEEKNIIRVRGEIYVTRNSQKAIIIGHKGEAIKKLGTEARKDIETFFNKKIYLELFVKVKKDWRNDEKMLRKFGYRF
ncbi:MAG: GTPase Era [Bacteroidota bacterium]